MIRLLLASVFVIAVASGCGSGDSGSGTRIAETFGRQDTSTPAQTAGPTQAVLEPIGGSEASGKVVFNKKPGGTSSIEIRIEGLEPISGEKQYVIWQRGSRHDMLAITSDYAGKDGRVSDDIQSATEPFFFLEDGSKTEILVTKVNQDDKWRDGLSRGSHGEWDPLIVGRPLLEGPIIGRLVGVNE